VQVIDFWSSLFPLLTGPRFLTFAFPGILLWSPRQTAGYSSTFSPLLPIEVQAPPGLVSILSGIRFLGLFVPFWRAHGRGRFSPSRPWFTFMSVFNIPFPLRFSEGCGNFPTRSCLQFFHISFPPPLGPPLIRFFLPAVGEKDWGTVYGTRVYPRNPCPSGSLSFRLSCGFVVFLSVPPKRSYDFRPCQARPLSFHPSLIPPLLRDGVAI